MKTYKEMQQSYADWQIENGINSTEHFEQNGLPDCRKMHMLKMLQMYHPCFGWNTKMITVNTERLVG